MAVGDLSPIRVFKIFIYESKTTKICPKNRVRRIRKKLLQYVSYCVLDVFLTTYSRYGFHSVNKEEGRRKKNLTMAIDRPSLDYPNAIVSLLLFIKKRD